MKTCYRCGIDFDATLYKHDAPCKDCQFYVPGQWLLKLTEPVKLDRASVRARDLEIKRLNALNWLDTEIAQELNISPSTVGGRRKKLGIPAVSTIARPERWQWKDPEAHLAHARQLVTHRKQAKRGRKASF